jgi:hypothetical protein
MKLRSGDGLLLQQQTGTNFNFASDAEGIDALVADGLDAMRTNDLPVILRRRRRTPTADPMNAVVRQIGLCHL